MKTFFVYPCPKTFSFLSGTSSAACHSIRPGSVIQTEPPTISTMRKKKKKKKEVPMTHVVVFSLGSWLTQLLAFVLHAYVNETMLLFTYRSANTLDLASEFTLALNLLESYMTRNERWANKSAVTVARGSFFSSQIIWLHLFVEH